jgi:hypothetical protein
LAWREQRWPVKRTLFSVNESRHAIARKYIKKM